MLQFPCPLPVTPPSIQSSNQGDLYIFCEAWRYGTETPNSACCDVCPTWVLCDYYYWCRYCDHLLGFIQCAGSGVTPSSVAWWPLRMFEYYPLFLNLESPDLSQCDGLELYVSFPCSLESALLGAQPRPLCVRIIRASAFSSRWAPWGPGAGLTHVAFLWSCTGEAWEAVSVLCAEFFSTHVHAGPLLRGSVAGSGSAALPVPHPRGEWGSRRPPAPPLACCFSRRLSSPRSVNRAGTYC